MTAEGLWQFQVEAWGDPIAHWRHDAGIKVPRGLETELMLTEGALLFERAPGVEVPAPASRAASSGVGAPRRHRPRPAPGPRWASTGHAGRPGGHADGAGHAAQGGRAAPGPAPCRRGTGSRPPRPGPVLAILAEYPLRDLITRSPRYPVIVHRSARAVRGLV